MISHLNMVSTIAGASYHKDLNLNAETIYLSYLPLAHVLERIIYAVITYFGGYYGFFSGDVLKIKDDIKELRPTIFASVPRLFNRFNDIIKGGLDKLQGVKKTFANRAVKSKLKNLKMVR